MTSEEKKAYMKQWGLKNKLHVQQYNKEYNVKTKPERSKKQKEAGYPSQTKWKAKNSDRHKEMVVNYKKNNKEKIAIDGKTYREKNSESIKAKAKVFRELNTDIVRARNKEYKMKNPDKVRADHLRRTFGLTPEKYAEMLVLQNHSCAICGLHQKQFKKNLYVDHCHLSNKIRGLLCQKCNSALGLIKDNVETLHKMIKYLSNE